MVEYIVKWSGIVQLNNKIIILIFVVFTEVVIAIMHINVNNEVWCDNICS